MPIIFSIGMSCVPGAPGCGAEPIDYELLRRVSNDRDSPIFDSSKPAGLYLYAPTPA